MIRKALAVVTWLVAGHALWLGLFWALVNVPESNAAMLAVSAVVVLLLLLVVALVDGTAGAWLLPGRSLREALHEAARAVPAVVVAIVVAGLFLWLGHAIDEWHEAHRGEIDAWLIARFDAPAATWPHRAIDALVFFVSGVVGVSLAVAALFARLEGGLTALARPGWVRAGFSRDQLTLVAIGMTVFVALPWQFAYWRPESLPPTWVQPGFAVAKLSLIFVAMNVGWMICLLAGARNASARS
jgi:hypothetical protein